MLGLRIVLLSDAPEACEVSFATWYLSLSASFLSSDVILEVFSGAISSALKPEHIPFAVVSFNTVFCFQVV